MKIDQASQHQLQQWERSLSDEYQSLKSQGLNLDLTRGKPSAEQLSLSDALDGILDGNYQTASGVDTRNYGGLEGIDEARQLGAQMLGLPFENVLAGGNSSLTLMHQAVMTGHFFGFAGEDSAWSKGPAPKFLCPAPGYDRHFAICEQMGIEMVATPMSDDGPDMDVVENLIKTDPSIRGIWCVPKYANPTGVVYSEAVTQRIAQLGKIANPAFRVFWDNAYAVHDLTDQPRPLPNVFEYCRQAGTEDSVLHFGSTSKITHAGAGVAFFGASAANLARFKQILGILTIGPDKVNQLRHAKLLPDYKALQAHMRRHAAVIKPRFDCVLRHLEEAFGNCSLGQWKSPDGGYFVSFDTRPGLAREVVRLAGEAGVKLTPAGATFPYGKDPQDSNIRIAPTVPTVDQLEAAMKVFVLCVKLATVRQALGR